MPPEILDLTYLTYDRTLDSLLPSSFRESESIWMPFDAPPAFRAKHLPISYLRSTTYILDEEDSMVMAIGRQVKFS